MKSFLYGKERVLIREGEYQYGGTALSIVSEEGEPIATLTVFVDGAGLLPGELLIKTYSENERISEAARKSGLFTDTGKRVKHGFVQSEIWRWK